MPGESTTMNTPSRGPSCSTSNGTRQRPRWPASCAAACRTGWMTATTAACFIAASRLRGRSATLALAAGGSYSMLAITLIGNMPINLRVFRRDEHQGDPEEWRRLRRRWDRPHSVRIPLDVAGFVLITLAALQAYPPQHSPGLPLLNSAGELAKGGRRVPLMTTSS